MEWIFQTNVKSLRQVNFGIRVASHDQHKNEVNDIEYFLIRIIHQDNSRGVMVNKLDYQTIVRVFQFLLSVPYNLTLCYHKEKLK